MNFYLYNDKYYELKNKINYIKDKFGWIKNYSKIDKMFLFFYDDDDINELFINLINIEINQIVYPIGLNNLSFAINHHIKILYNIILNNNIYKLDDLFDDNKLNNINNIIDNYQINYNNSKLTKLLDYFKYKLSDNKINIDYLKQLLKENIIYIKNRYYKKLLNFTSNKNIIYNDIIELRTKIKKQLNEFNKLKIDIKNKEDLLQNNNIFNNIISKYYEKILIIKKKLKERRKYINNNNDILDNMNIIINDVYNLLYNKNLENYKIINNEKNNNLTIYLNKKYLEKYLNKEYTNNIDIKINKIFDDINVTKNFELDDIKKIYENKNIVNHNELTYEEVIKYFFILYDNPLFNNIFDYISKQLNIELNKNIIKQNIDNICKYMLFTENDLSFKNIPSCDQLNNELYLELIHPKYCYERYLNEEILPHQKQGIFGFTSDTINYLDCNKYFFNTFLYKDNNKLKIDNLYTMQLNKLILYCMSKRDNIFCIRYVNNGLLPIHKINNDNTFFDTIRDINKNDIYLGILEKKINKLPNKPQYGDKIYYYIIYNGHYNEIFLYDHNMICTSNYYLVDPIVVTFMEIQQLCLYLNLYCYSYNKNDNYIFFSKYNIYDDNEKYDEKVYIPLDKKEFKNVINYYRSNMRLLKCFKYPGLNVNLPECIIKKYNDKLKNEIIRTELDINNIYNETQIYFYNNDDCSLTNHSFIK